MVTISRAEYERLKKLEDVDHELVGRFVESLQYIKAGRIRKVSYQRLREFEQNIANGKKFTRKDLGL